MSSALATTVLAYLPSPDRGVWYLGPVPIRAYALCIIVGIVVAVLWGERRYVARGGERGAVIDISIFAVPFGLIGGRIYHVATDWQKYFGPDGDPVNALKIWQGGLGIWGAVALGGVGAWIGCRRRGIRLPALADAVAPGIVVAQAIGRLGNWFNQELYGGPTTLPWGLEIYRRVDPATGAPDPLSGVALDRTPIEIVHPTFLYELLWNLVVAGVVVWADRRFRLGHGRAFALYVAGYTAGRFVIEQMRTDPATLVFGNLRINVVVSAVVFVAAAFYVALATKGREVLDGAVDAPDRERVGVGAGLGIGAVAAGGAAVIGGGVGSSGSGGDDPPQDPVADGAAPEPDTGPAEESPDPADADATGEDPTDVDAVAEADTGSADPAAAIEGAGAEAAGDVPAAPTEVDAAAEPDTPADPAPGDSADATADATTVAAPSTDGAGAGQADGDAAGTGAVALDPAAVAPADATGDGPAATDSTADAATVAAPSTDGSGAGQADGTGAASTDPAAVAPADATGDGPAATDSTADAAAVAAPSTDGAGAGQADGDAAGTGAVATDPAADAPADASGGTASDTRAAEDAAAAGSGPAATETADDSAQDTPDADPDAAGSDAEATGPSADAAEPATPSAGSDGQEGR